ncbi:MAG: hypothetical protein AB1714_24465 [Acidobacteriota bacterium]
MIAVLLTGCIAAGIVGMGSLAGGTSACDRWVRGWCLLCWPMALTASIVSPFAAVCVGLLLLTAGAVKAARLVRFHWKTAACYCAATLSAAWAWLAPPYFYDSLVYHIGLPWSWLMNGSYAPMDHFVMSRFPLAGQTVYMIPVVMAHPESAAGLHWAMFVICLGTLVAIARNLGGGGWSPLAPALLIGCWHATWLATVGSVDHLMLLGVLAAFHHLTEDGGLSPWRLGLPLGLALATKYQAALPALAIGAAAFIYHRSRARVVIAAGVVAVAVPSFWLVRNLLQTGNPVFPLLRSVIDTAGWTMRDADRFGALVHEGSRSLSGLVDSLAYLASGEGGLGVWVLLAAPLAVLGALGARGASSWRTRMTGLVLVMLLAGWLATSHTVRYAMPMAALWAALASAGTARLSRRLAKAAGVALACGVLLGLYQLLAFMLGVLGIHELWSGRISAQEWRHRVTISDPLPGYDRCSTLLPLSARLLIVGEGRPWGCPRPHQVSSAYDMQYAQEIVEEARSAEEIGDRIAREGYSHLFINWNEVRRLNGPGYRVLRWENQSDAAAWEYFLETGTRILWHNRGLEIREVLHGASIPATGLDSRWSHGGRSAGPSMSSEPGSGSQAGGSSATLRAQMSR